MGEVVAAAAAGARREGEDRWNKTEVEAWRLAKVPITGELAWPSTNQTDWSDDNRLIQLSQMGMHTNPRHCFSIGMGRPVFFFFVLRLRF